jgi:hypothetical protein
MRIMFLPALALMAGSAAAGPQGTTNATVTSRVMVQETRTWQTAGSLVELRTFDPGARTVTIGIGGREQTLSISDRSGDGFEALAAGGPLFLSWRFDREARPEALLRVLTEGGRTVTMVGRPSVDAR